VAPSVELMNDDAIVSNMTQTIRPTALCDNSEHLRLTR